MKQKQTGLRHFFDSQKEKLRIGFMIALAVMLIGAVLLSAFSIRNEKMRDKVYFIYTGDLHAYGVFPIDMDAETQNKRARATERHGQTGKFQFYCSPTLRMQAYYADGALAFGNVSDNDCALVITIFDENDKQIYRSGGVLPGNYIHAIRLSDPKPDGTYACKLYVTAYDLQTNAYIGTQYTDLTLVIGG